MGATEQDLVEVLLNEYDVDEAQAKEDVSAFVESLTKAGLIK